MKDLVHTEFMRRKSSYKGKRPPKERVRTIADIGGDLTQYFVKDGSVLRGVSEYNIQNGNYTYTYTGGFYPVWPAQINMGGYPWKQSAIQTAGVSGMFSGEAGSAASEGATWWRKLSPRMSTADLGQGLAEIGQVGPMLKTSLRGFVDVFKATYGKGLSNPNRLTLPKKVADHWINGQFGWRPFLSDCQDALYTYLNAKAKLDKLRKQNNRWVRRRTLVEEKVLASSEDVLANGHRMSYFPTNVNCSYVLGAGASTITGLVTQRTWGAGAFKYWIPDLEFPDEGIEKTLNYLRTYGIQINPLLLWNLIPWSWLVDWVSNVGDNIANYCSSYETDLVGRYAYVMRETSAVFTNTSAVAYYAMAPVSTRFVKELSWKLEYLLRTRRHAGPFGFATDWGNLNPKQWSILGALGLMRLH
jgi:hypothetical protein